MRSRIGCLHTLLYGSVPDSGACQYSSVWCGITGPIMNDQLSAKDWLDQGLKALASRGFTALKAEPLAKAMGVSRGSFYWHFADIGAYRAAILTHWREVAAEQVIAEIGRASCRERA